MSCLIRRSSWTRRQTVSAGRLGRVRPHRCPDSLEKKAPDLHGRMSEDAEATHDEVKRVRASISSLAWCAKEDRPDAAAGASVFASRMSKMKTSSPSTG